MNGSYDPKFRRLLDWAEARRDGITDEPIPSADDESLDAVMWIESFLDAAEVVARIEPPASLRPRLRRAFSNQRRPGDEQSIGLATLRLLADSRHPSELVGVRGSAGPDMQEAYQLLFGEGPATVFVEVAPTSAVSVRITGQIVDHRGSPTGTRVIGRTLSDARFSTTADEHGQFSLESVPADVVSLEIENGESMIGIELDLRDR